MQFLNEEDWKEFQEKISDAYHFLLQRNLEGEFKLLDKIYWKTNNLGELLNDYQRKRYKELQNYFLMMRKMNGNKD